MPLTTVKADPWGRAKRRFPLHPEAMTGLVLHNTLTKAKAPFVPGDPDRVTMYVCGPTVYDYAHIGNARPAVVFDVLFRLLQHIYGADKVIYARNITDIDDKIIAAAEETGRSIDDITAGYTDSYRADMAALGVSKPPEEPCATNYIDDIAAMIKTLIANGNAYEADGHVLFNVSSFDDYGRLSNRDREDMIAGARVEVAPYKKDPADFVLWKPSTGDLPGWESSWGRGRPGWHIECSAMIEKVLGETIDIHGGGHDLIFPHHENEIAQSRCSHAGADLARVWMHNGFLTMTEEKMSKSLGNIVTVHELLKDHAGETIRLALLMAHYRQPLDWSEGLLRQAKRTLDRLYGTLNRLAELKEPSAKPKTPGPDSGVWQALYDDLNTPKALGALSEIAHSANIAMGNGDKENADLLKQGLIKSGGLLGLLQAEPSTWLKGSSDDDNAAIDALIEARIAARTNKDFAEADRIRDQLAAKGISLEDGPGGTKWRRTN